MDSRVLDSFASAAANVMKTMAQTEAKAGNYAAKEGAKSWGVISGLIGMTSESSKGTLILSFDEPCLLEVVSKMFMEEFTSVTDEVADAVGELTNIILGNAKPSLKELGFAFDMSQPLIIRGTNVELKPMASGPSWIIPFQTPKGGFVIEINYTEAK